MFKWEILIRPSEKLEFHPSSVTQFFNVPSTIRHPLTLQHQLLSIFIYIVAPTD